MHAEGDMIHGCDADTTGAALQRQFLSATTTDPADDTTKPLPKVLDCGPLSNDCNTNQVWFPASRCMCYPCLVLTSGRSLGLTGRIIIPGRGVLREAQACSSCQESSADSRYAVRYRPTCCTLSAYALYDIGLRAPRSCPRY